VLASPAVVAGAALLLPASPVTPFAIAGIAAAATALVARVARRALARVDAAEGARRRADHNVVALTDASPEAIVIHRDGALLHVNPAARRLFRPGGTPTALADLVVDPALMPAAVEGQAHTVERELAITAGATVPVEMSTGLIDFAGGPAVVTVVRDLSARRQLRERLVVTERLVSLGTLAAGVAHEINNPLSVVLWNLELLRDELAMAGVAGEARKMVAEAMDAGERVRGIVADMRTLSRTPGPRPGPVDLVRAIDRALQLAAGTLKHRARIVRDYQQVPTVLADESRLVQVIINLLTNAADAIPADRAGQGTITVSTHVDASGGVVASVRDDGVGIPAELQQRIFDPFFTTKEVGVGTGLGLSISHNLVTSMDGRLGLESEPGRGTTVSVTLQAARDPAPTRRSEPMAQLRKRSAARILIVDDEAAIGAVATRLLGRAHDVSAVTSGRQALARLDAGERFDLVLCDLLMPEMTGLDLHARLRLQFPDQAARVVFMTGGVGQEARDAATRLPAVVLDKPLNARALTAFIDDYLARRDERAA
jgi:signal transduction histidine kinase/ActR/RegA family two-component response regulator